MKGHFFLFTCHKNSWKLAISVAGAFRSGKDGYDNLTNTRLVVLEKAAACAIGGQNGGHWTFDT